MDVWEKTVTKKWVSFIHVSNVLNILLVLLNCGKNIQKLGLFGTLKLALALQFIFMNAYFSIA